MFVNELQCWSEKQPVEKVWSVYSLNYFYWTPTVPTTVIGSVGNTDKSQVCVTACHVFVLWFSLVAVPWICLFEYFMLGWVNKHEPVTASVYLWLECCFDLQTYFNEKELLSFPACRRCISWRVSPGCLSVYMRFPCYLWVWELSAGLCSPGGGEAAFRDLYGCHKAAFIQLNSCFLRPGSSHPNPIGAPLWDTTLSALVCKALSSKNTNGGINKRHKTHLHENTEGIRDSSVSKDEGILRIYGTSVLILFLKKPRGFRMSFCRIFFHLLCVPARWLLDFHMPTV